GCLRAGRLDAHREQENGQPLTTPADSHVRAPHVSLLELSSGLRCMIIASILMRPPLAPFTVAALIAGAMAVVRTQSAVDVKLQGQLKQLFPAAASFSPKMPDPPHY